MQDATQPPGRNVAEVSKTVKRHDHPDAWRLPALQLESAIASAVSTCLEKPAFLPSLVPELDAAEVGLLREKVVLLAVTVRGDGSLPVWADLIEKALVSPGEP